jgi:hypothetical protein
VRALCFEILVLFEEAPPTSCLKTAAATSALHAHEPPACSHTSLHQAQATVNFSHARWFVAAPGPG